MPADLPGDLADGFPKRMPVGCRNLRRTPFIKKPVKSRPWPLLPSESRHARIVAVRAPRHAVEYPLRSRDHVYARIRTRAGYVVLEHYRTAVHGADERGVHVSHGDFRVSLPRSGESMFRIGAKVGLTRLERHEIVETVATIDIHILADRTQAMSGILISLMCLIPAKPPIIPASFGSVRFLIIETADPQIVDIGAFTMHQFTQHPKPAKIEPQHFHFTIAAVFKLHTVAMSTLGSFNQFPTFIQSHCGRHFDKSMFAALHSIYPDRSMQCPRRYIVYAINPLPFAHPLPRIFFACKQFCRRPPIILEPFGFSLDPHPTDVAQRGDFNPGNHGYAMDGRRSTAPQTDHPDAHPLQRSRRKTLHGSAVAAESDRIGASARHRRRAHPCSALDEVSSVHAHRISPFNRFLKTAPSARNSLSADP